MPASGNTWSFFRRIWWAAEYARTMAKSEVLLKKGLANR